MSTLFGPWGPLTGDLSLSTIVPTGQSAAVNIADFVAGKTATVIPTGGTTAVTLANLAASITPSLLPTTLPATAGVFWNNNGVLCIS
jgi:hypothetical protein